jgi:hypothetical protein
MEVPMSARINIKYGKFELEYEGEAEFIEKKLIDYCKKIVAVFPDESSVEPNQSSHTTSVAKSQTIISSDFQLTTSNIAAKINCSSGQELIIAAGIHLIFVQNKDRFTRQDVLDEIKKAPSYFKESYRKNLSNYLNSAVKASSFNEVSKGVFALSARFRSEIEDKIVTWN